MEGESQQLSQLEQVFRQPDAVMEPNIFDTLCQYVAAHGKPRTAIELLCENYVGYAHMGNLVCDWLSLTDAHIQRVEPQRGAAQQQDTCAAHFLREQVKADFDPDKFGSVFSMLDSSQLAWLEGLAADPAGRQLIYQLSATHRSCLLLNFAIQKILYAGHEDEVASVGSSLAGYFGVFHRLMASRLKEVPTASAARLAAIAAELQDSCCGAEHSYVHAAQLLAKIGRHKHGANFRRLAQQLEAYAAAPSRAGPELWHMQSWLATDCNRAEDAEAVQLVSELLTGPSGEAAHQKVARLRQLYSAQHSPSVDTLQQPQVLSKLVGAMFGAKTLPSDALEAHAAVAAIAAAAIDERPRGGPLDMRDVEATEAALRQGVRLAHDAANGTKFDAQQQRLAEAVLSTPVAAMGVLHLIGSCVGRKSYWRETYRVLAAPAFLNLLSVIVARQPLMHEKAMEIVVSAVVAVENSQPEVARLLLDVAAAILQAGQVELVLTAIEQRWSRTADPSQVRYFIFKVLEACTPPYSPFFAATMTRLMVASGVRRSRTGHRDGQQQAELLEEFAGGCADMKQMSLPLGPREVAFLRELRSERGTFLESNTGVPLRLRNTGGKKGGDPAVGQLASGEVTTRAVQILASQTTRSPVWALSMARTTHLIRSSMCRHCHQNGATRRCPSCGGAYYCQAPSACQQDDACSHKAACEAVSSAARTAACRMPTAAEAAALTNFVTVVDFQLSLPPLEDDFAAPASPSGNGCASSSAAMAMAALPGSGFGPAFSPVFSPALGDGAFSSDSLPGGACQLADSGASAPASACTPPQPSGESAADFLALRTEALEAVVDWLVSQAPCLLQRDAADLLLAHAVRLRDDGQCCELHLLAWAILDRCLTAGTQQFQDALTLQHSSFSDWTVDAGQHSPRQVSGLPLVSEIANEVLDTLTPVSVTAHADRNVFMTSPLEIPPMAAMMFPL